MKRGFTLVELITTFALTAVIIVLLLNVVIIIRNLYTSSNVKTQLYIEQSLLSDALNSKMRDNNLSSYEECEDKVEGEFCYTFYFKDATIYTLTVSESKITFDNFVYNLDNYSRAGIPEIRTETVIDSDVELESKKILIIKIPVECDLYPSIDYGINLIYQYL